MLLAVYEMSVIVKKTKKIAIKKSSLLAEKQFYLVNVFRNSSMNLFVLHSVIRGTQPPAERSDCNEMIY